TAASLARATRLARDLHVADPANAAHRRLYLMALLQAVKFRVGLDKPLLTGIGTAYAVAASQRPELIENLLSEALSQGYLPAAPGAAQVLGDIGSAALLMHGGAKPTPLAQAAGSADRRLRFAAVEAIVKLKPRSPFAGSSHVCDALGFFVSSQGTARVLVAHP